MTARSSVPLWFGQSERPLLGFYHAADEQAPRPCAVVLCYPFGHEYTAVYQAYRHLADRLAGAGFAVFRFDYDGTGDSAGGDSDSDRLKAWLGSIQAAIDMVLTLSGTQAVCLFGLRLGAALAYLAAAEHPSVCDLVLWAPVLTGRAYLREWRALRLLKERGGDRPPAEGYEEAGGFLMTRQTVADLGQVDLVSGPAPAVKRVFLLARDALLGEQRLADCLKARAVEVDYRFIPGYATLAVEPYNVVIPETAFTQIVAHLSAAHPVSVPPASRAQIDGTALPPAATRIFVPPLGTPVQETTVRFGADKTLFGILTEPAQGSPARHRPAVVLLNTSVIHRVGANRMYVPMARLWAAAGFSVLRLDVSGLGDSPLPGWKARERMYSVDGVRDVRAAMDFLSATRSISTFVLVGLCSGAYMAFHTGLEDPRVVSQVMLNPQTFEWKEGDSLDVGRRLEYKSFRFYLRTALRKDTYSRLFRGEINWKGILTVLTERALKTARTSLEQHIGSLLQPRTPKNSVLSRFRKLLQRNTSIFLIYSQEDPGLDEIALHLGKDAGHLRSEPRFKMKLIDGPDHTFTPVWSQRRLEEIITAYLLTEQSL